MNKPRPATKRYNLRLPGAFKNVWNAQKMIKAQVVSPAVLLSYASNLRN
jgi:hypothetical protein